MSTVLTKEPEDRLDYDFDFARWLTDGDTILSGDAEVNPPGELQIDTTELHGQVVKVWLSGGVSGSTYEVIVYASTENGRLKEHTACIRVRDCGCS